MLRIKKLRRAVIKFAEGRSNRDKNAEDRPLKLKIKKIGIETLGACPIKY